MPVRVRNAPIVFGTAKFKAPCSGPVSSVLYPHNATAAAVINSNHTNRLNKSPVKQRPFMAARIDPQMVSKLAERFLRGTERISTDHAGVGLGLAIVESIAQAHDGTLTLIPRAAGGLRVTVRIPAARR